VSSVTPEIHDSAGHGPVADLAARRAYEQAWRQFALAQDSAEAFCRHWLVIQCHAIGGVSEGVVVLLRPGTKDFVPVAFYPEAPKDRTHLARVSERALQEGQGVVEAAPPEGSPEAGEPPLQLAYPVRVDGEIRGVVGMEIAWRPEPRLQVAMRELQWGSAWLEVLLRRHADPSETERQRLKLALDLVSTLLELPGLRDSTTAFTTELAARLGCDRVTLGLLEGRRVRIAAVSHSPQFEKRANLVRAIERAMEEAVDQEAMVLHPPERDGRPVVSQAHETLLQESQAGSAATFPLEHGGAVIGALTFERGAGRRFDVPSLELCAAVASVAGPIIELKQGNEAGLPQIAGRSAKNLWEKLAGPGYPVWKLATLGIVALAVFFAFATGEFRVSGNATVEGIVQRAISAPINGFVTEAPLRAGDTVRQGAVIARLDDRDLRLERAKLEGQREQYAKQFREAMGKRERAQIAIVSAQIAQADAQLSLVEEQLARTTLVAPFDGLIVSGDLSQKLGAPVERGQVLFEVAPLEDYRVVLQVDEREIAYVAGGQPGELTVTSMPGAQFAFRVRTVTPVNVAKEGRNYYRVEAVLGQEAKTRLRPGMEGVGKIDIERRKLVWIWTHGLTDRVRLWLWSHLP
jgi:RND family efflux transporter MFP subunit